MKEENNHLIDIDPIIHQLLSLDSSVVLKTRTLYSKTVVKLCEYSTKLFLNEPMLLELEAPVRICGSIFGHYNNLMQIITTINFPIETNLLFLGNYIDRGEMGIECFCLLLALKIKYPKNIFLLRGSHESEINKMYGFYSECKNKYNIKLWKVFVKCFSYLPIAAIINGKVFCVHSGISPELKLIPDLNEIKRPVINECSGLVFDLLWAEPSGNLLGWEWERCARSPTFGESVVNNFLERNELELICRSSLVVQAGYEYFANQKLVSICSIERFLGFNNVGVVLDLDRGLNQRFVEIHMDEIKPKSV